MTNSTTLCIPRPHQLPTPRRVAVSAAAVPTVDVFAAVASAGGLAAWAVQVDSGDAVVGCLAGGPVEAAGAVLDLLEQLARLQGARLAVRSGNEFLQAGANRIPGVLGYPVADSRRDGRLRTVLCSAQDELAAAVARAPRLEVAVDGSWGRGSRSAGYAFLAADGSARSRADERIGSNAVAELRAIRLALESTPEHRRLLILTDSRVALRAIDDPHHAPAQLREEAKAVVRLLDGRDVRLRWVRGHAGPGLHDGADRLAVAARRALEAGLGRTAPAAQAGQIMADSLAAHRAMELAGSNPAHAGSRPASGVLRSEGHGRHAA